MGKQAGFTLIELVVVIVILGILAATAVPRFINLSVEANTAAFQGVIGAINSSSAINFGARSVRATAGVPIANCSDIPTLLEGGMPAGYTIAAAAIAAGTTVACQINQTATGTNANASVTGIL